MVIAGEPSGDALGSELVAALRRCVPDERLELFGAGGHRLAAAGVEIVADLTQHSMIGLAEAAARYRTFKRYYTQLLETAGHRRPDAVVCVDFAGFNLRFAGAVRKRSQGGWKPKIIQYVSPQVWASRPGRARRMARDLDLLLAIFPFEPGWYASHAPSLRVQFVGHPVLDRHAERPPFVTRGVGRAGSGPTIVLLPGSRRGEVQRHVPAMAGAIRILREAVPDARFRMVLPDEALRAVADPVLAGDPEIQVQVGGLAGALAEAAVAIASTGTVTLECALFGVPTVAIYRTSWLTYTLGKRLVTVRHLAMPNLLADEALFPELIQDAATPERIARATRDLLEDEGRREHVQGRLAEVVRSLGGPGASRRAAEAILQLI